MKFKRARGYTLIEVMIVISILGITASIALPRFALLLERAWQSKSKSELGSLRSALSLYYADSEGYTAFRGQPDGVASDAGLSLSTLLVPTYMPKMPVPYLKDHFTLAGYYYDEQAAINMAKQPYPWDIVFINGPPLYTPVNRPYAYDPASGHLYILNGNYDVGGRFFYSW